MIDSPAQVGTPEVKRSGRRRRVKGQRGGNGMVSHAGTALLRENSVSERRLELTGYRVHRGASEAWKAALRREDTGVGEHRGTST
jgi:hypothetical protein